MVNTPNIRLYSYKNCGTCKKAKQFLEKHQLPFLEIAIRDTPPTKAELQTMLDHYNGDIKRLFNTSGMDYRVLKIKDLMPTLTKDKAFELLSENGNLVKRPFLLSDKQNLVGFKEEIWQNLVKPSS